MLRSKAPDGPKKGGRKERSYLVTPDGLVGPVGRKSLIYIFCDAVVFVLKIKFIGAALWIGMACAKKKFNIR
jgi:hypothetical protein